MDIYGAIESIVLRYASLPPIILIPALILFAVMGQALVEVAIELFKHRPGHGITFGSNPLADVLEASLKDKPNKAGLRPLPDIADFASPSHKSGISNPDDINHRLINL
jgi:hypothetical protein